MSYAAVDSNTLGVLSAFLIALLRQHASREALLVLLRVAYKEESSSFIGGVSLRELVLEVFPLYETSPYLASGSFYLQMLTL